MEKIWLVKCLSHKREELSLNPWHGIKSVTVVWACRLRAGEVERQAGLWSSLISRVSYINVLLGDLVRGPEDLAHYGTLTQHACLRFHPQHCKTNKTTP